MFTPKTFREGRVERRPERPGCSISRSLLPSAARRGPDTRMPSWRRASQTSEGVLSAPAGNPGRRMRSDFLQATQQISRAPASPSARQKPLLHRPSQGSAAISCICGITWLERRLPRAGQTFPIRTLWAGPTPQVGLTLAPGPSLRVVFGNRSPEEEQRTLLSYRASLKLKCEKMQKWDSFVFVSYWGRSVL